MERGGEAIARYLFKQTPLEIAYLLEKTEGVIHVLMEHAENFC